MFPKIADFGPLEAFGMTVHPILHSYGLLLFGGFILGLWVAARRSHRYRIDSRDIYDLGIWLVLGALVGAKALLILLNPERFLQNPLGFLGAGGVFFGGFLGAAAAAIWFFRARGISVWNGGDLLAPSIALGHCTGRLGCFAAGCCYGTPTEGLTGVTFSDVYANEVTGVPLHTPLHPTQLYEAGVELALFGFLLWLAPRRRFEGQLFVTWLALYSVARFFIEFFRGDPRGSPFDGPLSTSQALGIVLLAAAFAIGSVLRRRTT